MKLTPEQQQVATDAIRAADKAGATYKQKKALIAAGLVESNLKNLNYGDRDSIGFLQQRNPWGSRKSRLDAGESATRFIKAAKGAKGATSGELAQNVQRSAFPDRYGQRGKDAASILASLGSLGESGSTATSARSKPGGVAKPDKAALLAYLQNEHDPDALLMLAASRRDVPSEGTELPSKPRSAPGRGGALGRPRKDVAELFYDPLGGVKNGQKIGAIGGHDDHVHFAGKTRAETLAMAKLAKKMGLTVRELAEYDPVDPVHVKNSRHYGKSGAGDASSKNKALMAEFFRRIAGGK